MRTIKHVYIFTCLIHAVITLYRQFQISPYVLNHVRSFVRSERVRDGVVELEGERSKRRRLERDKKVAEAEVHKLKTMLSVTSGGE